MSIRARFARYAHGIGLATFIALISFYGAIHLPLIGAPVLAIVLGVLARTLLPLHDTATAGLRFSAKYVLQAAIITSGFAISFQTVVHTGISTLPVTLVTITVALGAATILGRLLKLGDSIKTLIGVGTAICGASAIAAVSAVLAPEEGELAVSLATIFFYNITAVLTFPAIGHILHLTQDAFGLWAGTAINDTSSVVAAGYAYGKDAGAYATIVKLTRATLILPIVASIAFMRARRNRTNNQGIPWMRIVPWFIIWFLVAALVNTAGFVPIHAHTTITMISTLLISIALAAIGLQTRAEVLKAAGIRPLFFGGMLWVAVACASLVAQRFTGT